MGIGRKRSERVPGSPIGAINYRQVGQLFSNFNRVTGTSEEGQIGEGVISKSQPELTLDLSDEQILKLTKSWQETYKGYYQDIQQRQQKNEDYYFGKQFSGLSSQYDLTDNIIFECVETLLPLASRENPEPLVLTDNSPKGTFVADNTAKMLSFISDEESLKLKIKQVARHWCLYLLGCFKVSWNFVQNEIAISVVRPQNLILDPAGTFDGGEFRGRFIGERKRDDASTLIRRFPDAEEKIMEMVGEDMGTELGYIEWWTDEYVCWTIGDIVLDKRQNPNWNYEPKTQVIVDEMGMEQMVELKSNHFKRAKKPYSFFWCFNTGKGPFDETSLIEQCRSLQDGVNKRARQIDRNADDNNNGWVFSSAFDLDQAKTALNAMRRGGAIIAPSTSINDSVQRFQAAPLPSFILEELYDLREQIRNIFGVRGSTAQGIMNEKTVRGKIEIKGQDTDRMALIVEHLEQSIDYLFNYMVQMFYVYYDEKHTASLIGEGRATQYIEIQNTDLNRQLIVSVKEGSMIPQDPLMRRNEAMDLFSAGALDPVTLFERLDFPNPQETAQRLMQFRMGQVAPPAGAVPADAPPDSMSSLPPIPPVQ